VVPDGLSRRPRNYEEGEPVNIDRFIKVEEITEEEEKAILMSKAWKVEVYVRITIYLIY
jgi:hypothetical protein